MKREGEFSARVKDVLAKRSGYRCNNPECRRMTLGAHSNPDKFMAFGQACHIVAASPGGPRFNSKLSVEQRKNISNGIWLCYSCAKIIDGDPERYTVALLKEWKMQAEERNLHEAAIQAMSGTARVISVTNVAGGTGKSTATAMIGQMIAERTHKPVLCISVHRADHALVLLNNGDWNKIEQEQILRKNERTEIQNIPISPFAMQNKIVPALHGVDTLSFEALSNLILQQELCFGESSVRQIVSFIENFFGYQYIVCDCGRGEDSLQKAILNISTDIIVPTGERSYFGSTLAYIRENGLQSREKKNVWFFMSKGNNKYVADNLLPRLKTLPTDRANTYMLETIVPYNKDFDFIEMETIAAIKNVLVAYRKIVMRVLAEKPYRA